MKRLSTIVKELENKGFNVYINDHDNMVTLTSERGNMEDVEEALQQELDFEPSYYKRFDNADGVIYDND